MEAKLKAKQESLERLEAQLATEKGELQTALKELSALRGRATGQPPAQPVNVGTLPSITPPRMAACRMGNLSDFNTAFLHVDDEGPSGDKELNCLTEDDVRQAYGLTDEKAQLPIDTAEMRRSFLAESTKVRKRISEALADSVAQSLPERANLQPGFTAAVSLSSGSRASMAYSLPIRLDRDADHRDSTFEWQSPSVLALNASISVPIDEGEARLASAAGDKLKAASGFAAKIGLDFSLFSRQNRPVAYRRAANVLYEALSACIKDNGIKGIDTDKNEIKSEFFRHYGLGREYLDGNYRGRFGPDVTAKDLSDAKKKEDDDTLPTAANNKDAALGATFDAKCTGSALVRYILEVERDSSQTSGLKRKHPELADKFWQLFWDDGGEYSPNWGAGLSFEHSWTDFSYSQATLNPLPDSSDPTKISLAVDRKQPLAPGEEVRKGGIAIEGYVSAFKTFWKNPFMTPTGIYSRGVMFLFSGAYRKSYEFRPGTKGFNYCPASATGEVFGSCSTVNIDRPYRQSGFELAGEFRTRFDNVPLVKLVGLAPKYTYRLDDGAQSLDLPIFLTADDKGVGQTGIRVLHTWNGRDLLDNDLKPQWKLALFFSTKLDLLGR